MEETNSNNQEKKTFAKSEKTRRKIFEVARKLFIEKGYDGVSIGNIASRARVTKGHIYYYFDNKQHLFDSILDEYFAAQSAALLDAVGSGTTIQEKAHAGIDAYLDFVEENPGFPRLIQREVCNRNDHAERISRYLNPLFEWGQSIFKSALPDTGPMSTRQLFISFYGLLINYYTYSPILEKLWNEDTMAIEMLKERRTHIHHMLDIMLMSLMAQ